MEPIMHSAVSHKEKPEHMLEKYEGNKKNLGITS
jgi:hypothetical protein